MAGRIHDAIVREVSGWPGVTTGRHRFGGIEFRLEGRELGHLHGSRLADLPFPLLVRDDLVAAGRAEPHHIHPDSGWVSYFIQNETDIAQVVALFRLNYERPWRTRTDGPELSRPSFIGPYKGSNRFNSSTAVRSHRCRFD